MDPKKKKKIIVAAIVVAIAACVIGGALWYNNRETHRMRKAGEEAREEVSEYEREWREAAERVKPLADEYVELEESLKTLSGEERIQVQQRIEEIKRQIIKEDPVFETMEDAGESGLMIERADEVQEYIDGMMRLDD